MKKHQVERKMQLDPDAQVENRSSEAGFDGASVPSEVKEEETVTLAAVELDALQKELEESRKKSSEYFDGWQRERADFSNYKKRVDREQATLSQSISGELLKKYLIVSDDLERAFKNRPQGGDGAAWADGIELIYRKLQSILETEGVKRMDAEHEIFDPTRHEAISYEPHPEKSGGEIIEVLQPGYMLGDRVLRPALVRVAQ